MSRPAAGHRGLNRRVFIAEVAKYRGVSEEAVVADSAAVMCSSARSRRCRTRDAVGTYESVLPELSASRSPGARPSAQRAALTQEHTMNRKELEARIPSWWLPWKDEGRAEAAPRSLPRSLLRSPPSASGSRHRRLPVTGHAELITAAKADPTFSAAIVCSKS